MRKRRERERFFRRGKGMSTCEMIKVGKEGEAKGEEEEGEGRI